MQLSQHSWETHDVTSTWYCFNMINLPLVVCDVCSTAFTSQGVWICTLITTGILIGVLHSTDIIEFLSHLMLFTLLCVAHNILFNYLICNTSCTWSPPWLLFPSREDFTGGIKLSTHHSIRIWVLGTSPLSSTVSPHQYNTLDTTMHFCKTKLFSLKLSLLYDYDTW